MKERKGLWWSNISFTLETFVININISDMLVYFRYTWKKSYIVLTEWKHLNILAIFMTVFAVLIRNSHDKADIAQNIAIWLLLFQCWNGEMSILCIQHWFVLLTKCLIINFSYTVSKDVCQYFVMTIFKTGYL